ncbi:MAG: DUF3306 domain-containing protein [Burkholderiales bacterium]|nr:DUF3306 domain-containing protein [Burkholderiales bacterium]
MSNDNFLSRWSKRKTAVRRGEEVAPVPATAELGIAAQAVTPSKDGAQSPAEPPLPPVESLTPESDFTPFMKPDVDPGLRQQAMRTLMRDPRFNVMDGLDVYIDDYSKPDPLPPEWLGQLNMMKRLGSFVEPTDEEAKKAADEEAKALRKQMPEQPVALPEGDAQGDASSSENSSVEGPESGVSRNGNS